jgi:hypothetical protein
MDNTPVSSTNKTDNHDIVEILLKVALNTTKPNQSNLPQGSHEGSLSTLKYTIARGNLCVTIYLVITNSYVVVRI